MARSRWWWLAVLGPGLMVMLADTDAGSIITAAQSGAEWGYALVLPQLLLIPVLYTIQEMTVRLGTVTGKGHGALIREHFGLSWAAVSVTALLIACVGALVTEFVGIAGVGALFGIPQWLTVGVAAALLIALVLTEGYKRVERIGITVGLLELFFIAAAILAHPNVGAIGHGLSQVPLGHSSYRFLLAANVGAVIMPWMVFYQQGAIVDKGLHKGEIRVGRWDTLAGAVITQMIMIAVIIATAATIGATNPGASLPTVGAIAQAFAPFVGTHVADVVFGLGLGGAGFVAALVVSLAAAWGVSEVLHWRHSLDDAPGRAPGFYWLYTLAILASGILVVTLGDLVNVAVDVEVMNAMLLPIVIGFLLMLEARALPSAYRTNGIRRYLVWGMAGVVMVLGLYTVAVTLHLVA